MNFTTETSMKIAILSSHTTSLFWFRLDLMKDLIQLGHCVTAFGPEPEPEWKMKFRNFGINYNQIPVARNGINPLTDLNTLVALYRIIKREKPDVVFSYHSKTIVYGNIAGFLNRVPEIYSLFSGLGSIFRGNGIKNKVLRVIMKIQYFIACAIADRVFFQNPDDQNVFIKCRLVSKEKCNVINGSGVNIEHFKPVNFPSQPAFLYIGRLIRDKGVMEYLNACRKVKKRHPEIRCMLVGPYDSNPSALKKKDIYPFIEDGSIEFFGEQPDVRPFLGQCSVYVLPSYHEGTPKTVLEAMAMERPIITTNTVGCKETVKEGINGFLVPLKNSQAVAEKMEWFIMHPAAIKKMGSESLTACRKKYDVKKVNKEMLAKMKLLPERILHNEEEMPRLYPPTAKEEAPVNIGF